MQEDGQYEFKGHILTPHLPTVNFNSIKSDFINRLIANLHNRFLQKSVTESFYVLAMRSINWESAPEEYGNKEMSVLLSHFGEEQTHKGSTSAKLR
ncbi:uncharacterized protein [Haliotis asinina]|uniref:uncharacterized protein n=1 Tax=Haliotis asinina TaxID=109174 RepID=UPI003531AE66